MLVITNSIITDHSLVHWIVVLQVGGVGFVVGVLCPCCYIRQHLFILFFWNRNPEGAIRYLCFKKLQINTTLECV